MSELNYTIIFFDENEKEILTTFSNTIPYKENREIGLCNIKNESYTKREFVLYKIKKIYHEITTYHYNNTPPVTKKYCYITLEKIK